MDFNGPFVSLTLTLLKVIAKFEVLTDFCTNVPKLAMQPEELGKKLTKNHQIQDENRQIGSIFTHISVTSY